MLMKPVKKLLAVIIKGCIGLGAVYLFNMVLSNLGIHVGINIVNGFVMGLLGVPGFFLLYSLALVDKFL